MSMWSGGWDEWASLAQHLGLATQGPLAMPGVTLR
jgi:hypothetical protein